MEKTEIVTIANSWLNTPYKHQASLKGAGCDCLGLLRGVYRELYNVSDPEKLPPYRPDWYERTEQDTMLLAAKKHLIEVPKEEMGVGMVLIFRMKPNISAKHCAILVDSDIMIHAYSKKFVAKVSMGTWWKEKIVGVFKFPGVVY